MTIKIIILILFFVFILYCFVFLAPSKDMVFSSGSEAEIRYVQAYLEENGIRTYTKNENLRRIRGPYPPMSSVHDPSLHVVNPKEYAKALEMIKSLKQPHRH